MTEIAWAQLSNNLIASAMVVYALALVAYTADLAWRAKLMDDSVDMVQPPKRTGSTSRLAKAVRIGTVLTGLAVLLHGASVLARAQSVHRPPWGNMYEFAISGSFVVALVYVLVTVPVIGNWVVPRAGKARDLRFLGLFIVAAVELLLGLAVSVLYTAAGPLVPALRSYWLGVHVSVAFIATALFTLGAVASALYLLRLRREELVTLAVTVAEPDNVADSSVGLEAAPERQRWWLRPWDLLAQARWVGSLPSASDLDQLAYRFHIAAFPLWGFTLIAGAIWAEGAWGRYWGWDPKEVWTFIIWVVYAGYLHARATGGWQGRRSAYIALFGYACLLCNFFVVNIFFVGKHSYAA